MDVFLSIVNRHLHGLTFVSCHFFQVAFVTCLQVIITLIISCNNNNNNNNNNININNNNNNNTTNNNNLFLYIIAFACWCCYFCRGRRERHFRDLDSFISHKSQKPYSRPNIIIKQVARYKTYTQIDNAIVSISYTVISMHTEIGLKYKTGKE